MTGSVAVVLGLSPVIVVTITVSILVRRGRRLSPADRYQRDIRGLRTSTYLRTEPRSARQEGAYGLENKYGAGAWMG